MKRIKPYFWCLSALAILSFCALSACTTLEGETKRILKEKYDMTEEEAITGAAHAIRLEKAQKNPDGELVTENGYLIDYEFGISLESRYESLTDKLADLHWLLNEREMRDNLSFWGYINHFAPIKERLREQKTILEFKEGRYAHVIKYLEFLEKLGINTKMLKKIGKYHDDAWISCPLVDLKKEAPFEPDYVVTAKKSDRQEVVEKRTVSESFYLEKDNPDYPAVTKTEKTVKVMVNKSLLYRSISIDGDKKADYVEVFRLDKDGQPEEFPIIAAYHTLADARLTLLKLDIDEPGHPSFGVPEEFVVVYDVESGIDIEKNHRDLILQALKGREKEKEFELAKHEMRAFFARPGETKIAEAEINAEGWPLPDDYSQNGNFEIFIKYVKEDKPMTAAKNMKPEPRKIEWVALRYHAPINKYTDLANRPVEFYHPAAKYAELKYDGIRIDEKRLELYSQGQGSNLLIQYFIADKPFRIDYDSGKKRISVFDNDGDGLYEAKKEEMIPTKIELENDAKVVANTPVYDGYH
jgi:hypothetical protein